MIYFSLPSMIQRRLSIYSTLSGPAVLRRLPLCTLATRKRHPSTKRTTVTIACLSPVEIVKKGQHGMDMLTNELKILRTLNSPHLINAVSAVRVELIF